MHRLTRQQTIDLSLIDYLIHGTSNPGPCVALFTESRRQACTNIFMSFVREHIGLHARTTTRLDFASPLKKSNTLQSLT
jgi:hypothetical protein